MANCMTTPVEKNGAMRSHSIISSDDFFMIRGIIRNERENRFYTSFLHLG
jgi:hypothetical protein